MEYRELKSEIEGLDEPRRRALSRVLSLAAIGGDVRPEFRNHLSRATACREFFESLYADDELRFTRAWAAWARCDRKDWIGRFTAGHAVGRVPFAGRGLPLELSGGTLLVPLNGHGKAARVFVFDDGAFNEDAADYFTSIEGAFTCAGMAFDGIYDVFTSGNAVLFERWELDAKGARVKAAKLAEEYGLTG